MALHFAAEAVRAGIVCLCAGVGVAFLLDVVRNSGS